MKSLLVAAAAMTATGCASLAPVGLIYTNTTVPQSYRSNTYEDVEQLRVLGDVEGQSCASNILGLIAYGDAGYNAAVEQALATTAGAVALYDVRTDAELFSILGIYSTYCTIVHAKAAGTGGTAESPKVPASAVSDLVYPGAR